MERNSRKDDFRWEEHGLSEEFILRVFKAIHQESINNQKKILNK